jgi:hypothetical protein
MDQAALVENQIEIVPKLLAELKKLNFNVLAAYWLYTGEADQWYLYLVTDEIKNRGITESYKIINRTLKTLNQVLQTQWIDPFQVKLVNPDDETAKAVMDFKSNMKAPVPWTLRNTRLGDKYIENAYIFYI